MNVAPQPQAALDAGCDRCPRRQTQSSPLIRVANDENLFEATGESTSRLPGSGGDDTPYARNPAVTEK